MKKIGIALSFICMIMFIGCAGPYSGGMILSDYNAPASSPDDATGLQIGSKVGEAKMVNYVGWVAMGDASIKAAAKNGGISKVKTVDYKFNSILGIINTTTTIVTGE